MCATRARTGAIAWPEPGSQSLDHRAAAEHFTITAKAHTAHAAAQKALMRRCRCRMEHLSTGAHLDTCRPSTLLCRSPTGSCRRKAALASARACTARAGRGAHSPTRLRAHTARAPAAADGQGRPGPTPGQPAARRRPATLPLRPCRGAVATASMRLHSIFGRFPQRTQGICQNESRHTVFRYKIEQVPRRIYALR